MKSYRGTMSEETTQVSNHNCAAHGCPLPGSMSAGLQGEGTWFCRNHFGTVTSDRDAITTRIRKYQWMIQVAVFLNHCLESDEGLLHGEERFSETAARIEAGLRQRGVDIPRIDPEFPHRGILDWERRIYVKFDALVNGLKPPTDLPSPIKALHQGFSKLADSFQNYDEDRPF